MPGELLGRIETRGERPEDSLGQNPSHSQPPHPELLFGIDLGAAEVKITAFDSDDAALCQARAASRGNPLAALLDVISQLPGELRAGPVRIAVTGGGQYLLDHLPSCLRMNEALATALAVRRAFPGARTVIDLGGLSSKWILLGRGAQDTVVDFSSNGLCAAGAGAFLEQQAGRLGLTLDRLGNIAAVASKGASIAGRCSVFAKSDMIHLQQKGTPLEEIAYGLCQALARTFLTTVAQGRVGGPHRAGGRRRHESGSGAGLSRTTGTDRRCLDSAPGRAVLRSGGSGPHGSRGAAGGVLRIPGRRPGTRPREAAPGLWLRRFHPWPPASRNRDRSRPPSPFRFPVRWTPTWGWMSAP